MTCNEARRLAYDLLDRHGLHQWRFAIDTRAKRRCGQCRYSNKTVALTEYFIINNLDEDIRDCLLHEIAHALVGPGHGHNAVWRRKAAEIGAKPERCRRAVMPEMKWHAVCLKCNEVLLRRHRRDPKWERCHHTKCGPVEGRLMWRESNVA